MDKIEVRNEESHFDIEELFFSHTDKKGRILYGNDVFVRVSEYSFDELRNKPHNIIRHPSMPKAVFQILWEFILDNKPVVAYVKNRSKLGKHYWVIALVFPFKEGFLSIRIKPTSEIFNLVQELYSKTLDVEKQEGLESSRSFLLKEISALGFQDYPSFMVSTLIEEIKSREEKRNSTQRGTYNSVVSLLEETYKACLELDKSSRDFHKEFAQLKLMSINMIINTEQYGEAGSAIGVTSHSFSQWSDEIKKNLEVFLEKQNLFKEGSFRSRLTYCIAALQDEMATFFRASKDSSEIYIEDLDKCAEENRNRAKTTIVELTQLFSAFLSALKNLNESLLALKIIKLNSRIESAHLPDGGKRIEATVSGTTRFISFVEDRCRRLEEKIVELKKIIDQINDQ